MDTTEFKLRSIASSPVLWTSVAVALVITMMWPTASSVVDIWSKSQTFTHGYLVFPAFFWLVWRKRGTLAELEARPEWRGLALIAFFGACWLISGLAGIQVGEHAALALIIMSTIWSIVGTQVAKAILFPILFLFFLAPVGEELVPYLMELTADVTVWAIRVTGIPIYREGLFFSLPSGDWSVVEACSGINYLISSISLGSLYAYLSYNSYKTRTIFMIIATILPIVANSVRAYIIVMLGHFSSNKVATGVDHLIYGWFFFGIVMFLLFSIGNIFQDSKKLSHSKEKDGNQAITQTNIGARKQVSFRQYLPALMGVALTVGLWPLWALIIKSGDAQLQTTFALTSNILPDAVQSHDERKSTAALWQPRMNGFDIRLDADYTTGSQPVRALAFVYLTQHQGKEMISSANVLVRSKGDDWRSGGSTQQTVSLPSATHIIVKETSLLSTSQELVVWQWYQVGDTQTTNPIRVKLYEMLGKLMLKNQSSTTYILVTNNTPSAQNVLREVATSVLEN